MMTTPVAEVAALVHVVEEIEEIPHKQKLKPCCACPETKKVRDTWYILFI